MEYETEDGTAVLHFDDGKANAIGHDFMDAMLEGLKRAEQEAAAAVIVGRQGLLSAGFDLKEFEKGADATRAVIDKGANMFLRLFSFPKPLVIGCTGHAIAAGAFLLLAADTRIGAAGEFKIGLNETAIGSPFPVFGVQLARARLNPAYLTRSFVQSELFTPEQAVHAGFLDRVERADGVRAAALATAHDLSKLPAATYAKNKRDIRRDALDAIEASL